ncbi:hypothetical protein HPB50_029137 [Hyalomma asiaticum]|nr:hypothetical protein HPB50_029137 [Hyalomma asiaticum]
MGSSGAATAASIGRGNRNTEDNEYQFILPQLPKGKLVINTVFSLGDVRARPYKVEHFRDVLTETGLPPDVLSLGAYKINHLWVVTFNDAAPTKRLHALKEEQGEGAALRCSRPPGPTREAQASLAAARCERRGCASGACCLRESGSVAEPEQAAKEVVPAEADEAAATQGETSGSGDEMSVTSATLKRSHEKTTEVEKTSSTSDEEPPA